MTDKLVIDTCVFIEGIFGDEGNPSSLLLEQLDSLDARLVFSQDSIGELLYILKRECNEIQLSDTDIMEILTDIMSLFQRGKSINIKHYKNQKGRVRARDKDDQMFIDAAFASKSSHLITLDKKSGILNLKNTPFICCTPKSYIDSKTKIEKSG
ncbi:putative toxin-antitoxin system toxin component, PIN family [Heyndrickxia camelliae]|uniref:Putative toxin-antitoxin system toxin component, PIN family n=1 Tax=Heyndrickxia camelliae TaxID=1707093 RepID=A0A2N3LE63_9BACI|nr:putative toxin-antitoxin system toxin component, PIN family [Heyndrickxia camelliae]PKR82843.1 putative toxin-antitoxin system toxin component, PIN family [Heyndrickxia camelliae]